MSSRPHLLIVHPEAEYFAGAERVLGYFLEGLESAGLDVTVAAVEESRVSQILPQWVTPWWLPRNARFSPIQFYRQADAIRRLYTSRPFDIIHGWAIRDWELTSLMGRLTLRPALGTLHDHPQAPFISKSRRMMMVLAARQMRRVVCVSEALRSECVAAGYPPGRLIVVHNGLPSTSLEPRGERAPGPFHLGYLGQFTERKGLKGLFETLDALAGLTSVPWDLVLAGEAQDEAGKRLVQSIKDRSSSRPWWPQIRWCGWVKQPAEFLRGLDLLICPSSEFDPFPTVVLEAGRAGIPVLGAQVGGVPEMIEDGRTGWLFAAQAWSDAAQQLRKVLEQPSLAAAAGRQAKKRVEGEFTIERMVQNYLNVYMEITVSYRYL